MRHAILLSLVLLLTVITASTGYSEKKEAKDDSTGDVQIKMQPPPGIIAPQLPAINVPPPPAISVPKPPVINVPPSPVPPQQQERRGVINPRTGEYLPPSGEGVINPRTGEYYFPSKNGYYNPKTGDFIPRRP